MLRIGTSGWIYRHWRDIFYPPRMKETERLPFFAGQFDTVELNVTFYRLPPKTVFEGWRARTPDGFLYAVKASRLITHVRKLRDASEPLSALMKHADALGDKFGPVLFQFPPTFEADTGLLAAFLATLRAWPDHRFTMEFRHPSWLSADTYRLLEGAGVALCLPVHPDMPLDVRLTAPWTYIRMHYGRHGWGFGDDELDEWADRLRAWLAQGCDAYVYFNNDPDGHAIDDARRLRDRMARCVPPGTVSALSRTGKKPNEGRGRWRWTGSTEARQDTLQPPAREETHMATRTSDAEWRGDLKSGQGTMRLGSGLCEGPYTFASRFEEGKGTNPEELIGAAHAGCFSMALSAALAQAGHPPTRIHTTARVTVEKVGDGFAITTIALNCEGEVPGLDETQFRQQAEVAKANCPVSKALSGVNITLDARLV